MWKIFSILLALSFLTSKSSNAGYRSIGRSGGYRSASRGYHSSNHSYSHHTTIVRNGGGFGSSGMVTGMLIGSALAHHGHHGHYGHYGDGYSHHSGNYNNYANGPIPSGYQVNLCSTDKGLYDYAMRVCQDINCVNTYCFR